MRGLDDVLARSSADPAFKADVRAFVASGAAARVTVERYAPRVKVLRVVAQLLDAESGLAVERVRVIGTSGCCDFRGRLAATAGGAEYAYDFVWDCRWRAVEEGWVDRYGFADQSRAAREFGWRCFSLWQRVEGDRGR